LTLAAILIIFVAFATFDADISLADIFFRCRHIIDTPLRHCRHYIFFHCFRLRRRRLLIRHIDYAFISLFLSLPFITLMLSLISFHDID